MTRSRVIRSLLPPLAVAAVLAVAFLAPPRTGSFNGVLTCYSYAYQCGAPTVTNVNPNFGPMVGGTAVTLTGTNFNNSGVVVHFGSALATSVVIVSDTSITANSPASASAGIVNVQVTTPAGSSANSANNQFTFQQPGPCTGAGISANLTSPQPSGTTITFTATSSTCTTPEYLFYVQALGGPWIVGQTYGGPTYAWNTVGNGVTTYTIDVWVRQTGHTAAEESAAVMSFTLSVIPACTAAGVAPDKATPQQSGTIITFTATSASCPNPEYLFYFQAAGGPWILGRGYGGPTFVWNTAGNGAVAYSVDVWVRQMGTTVSQQNAHVIAYTLSAPVACTAGGISALPTSPQATGTSITFTGSSASCSQPEYLYYFQAAGGPWILGRTYGASTFVWVTTGNGKTTYTVDVWVHQNGSSAPHEAFAVMSYTLN
jgi:hypothetical protein